jgi:hypothetical protein
MASDTRQVTLAANTVTTTNFTGRVREVGILHTGNVPEPVYVRVDGTAPTVAGDGSFVVLAGQQRFIPREYFQVAPTVVKIISAGAAKLEVEFP